MKKAIVREVIHGQRTDGIHVEIIIEIGAPSPYKRHPNEWTCKIKAPALSYPNAPIHVGSALQALCLALSSAPQALTHFRSNGGKLGYAIGHGDYDIDSTFGVSDLVRKP